MSEKKFCPECGLFKPCSTCGKPRVLQAADVAALQAQLERAQQALRTLDEWACQSAPGSHPEDEPEPVRLDNEAVAMLCREALKES